MIERWRQGIADYELLLFDTGTLLGDRSHAAVENPLRYRHRSKGKLIETTKANFWTLEDGCPVKLIEYYGVGYIQCYREAWRRTTCPERRRRSWVAVEHQKKGRPLVADTPVRR